MSTETPPAPVVATPSPAAVAAKPPAASPKLPVAPGSQEAHLAAAKQVWGKDPAKAATPPAPAPKATVEPAKPAEVPAAVPPLSEKKPDAPAPTEFPEDRLPEPASEQAKSGWKELKTIAKTERTRATELAQKVADLESKMAAAPTPAAVDATQLADLQAKLKQAHDRLLVVSLQDHPDFHRQFVEPRKKAFAESQTLLTDNGITEAVNFDTLITKPRAEFAKTVSELSAKMNTFDAQTFTANMRQAYQSKADEAGQLANAADVHAKLQAKSQQVQRQAFDTEATENLTQFKPMEVPEGASDETKAMIGKYNESLPQLRQKSEALAFGKLDERGVARLSMKATALDHMTAHLLPAMKNAIKDRDTYITSLVTEIRALKGQKAPGGGGDVPAGDAPPAGETIEQAAKRVWKK